MVEEPPFQIEETGWGGFQVEIKLFFIPEVGRAQDRVHFLQLETYGDEAQQQKQKEEKMVRSEFLDYIEFNEPTEALFDILTDESQFQVPRTTGKGKGKVPLKRENGEGSVELPETSTASNPYSKELEESNLTLLKKALAQVEELSASEDAKLKSVREQLAKVRGGG